MKNEKLQTMESTTGDLVVPIPLAVKNELAFKGSAIEIDAQEEKDLSSKADQIVRQLVEFDMASVDEELVRKEAVEHMGLDIQRKAAKQSSLLKQPIKALSQRSEDGGDVANALIGLKLKVEELDPGRFDFEPGWFSRIVGRLPGIGSPMKRYFTRYESAQTVIAAIIRSLENGRDQLLRDNVTLVDDQKQMRDLTHKLQMAVKLGQLIDQKLENVLQRETAQEDPKHRFISEELLFPLRQRIIDLQQQLAVNQQGVLASEIIIRNNKELARGVNRSLNVTVTALEVGVTVAMALANQKIVLEKVQSVSKTTSDLIAGTASRLKTQGVEIHKQASSAQLDISSLKSAFADIKIAMDDVSNFRVQALPQMAKAIQELDEVSAQAEESIKKMEDGNRVKPQIRIDIE